MLARYYPNALDSMAPRSLDPSTGEADPGFLEQLKPVGDALLSSLGSELQKQRDDRAAAIVAAAQPSRVDLLPIVIGGAVVVVVGLIMWRALR